MYSVIITLLRLKLQMAMENLKIVVNINIHIIKKDGSEFIKVCLYKDKLSQGLQTFEEIAAFYKKQKWQDYKDQFKEESDFNNFKRELLLNEKYNFESIQLWKISSTQNVLSITKPYYENAEDLTGEYSIQSPAQNIELKLIIWFNPVTKRYEGQIDQYKSEENIRNRYVYKITEITKDTITAVHTPDKQLTALPDGKTHTQCLM